MKLELYKILEEVKDVKYDQSDMGEPGTVYIPPLEVPLNATRHLWQVKPSRTIGGGPHRQSRNARLQKPCHDSKPAPHAPDAERQAWQASFFVTWITVKKVMWIPAKVGKVPRHRLHSLATMKTRDMNFQIKN